MNILFNLKKTTYILLIIIVLASFLRLWRIDQVPVSLFGDELDLGYQAYSILKTGKDYSGNFLPIHFQSLAEWRTPLYLYSAVPTVAIFGISPWGVRLPAAIFGILSTWAICLLVAKITNNKNIGLLAAFILAVSPWHIQYSRAGFEVTQMLFLYILGLYFFIAGLKKAKLLSLSAIFFALTPYAYSTAKLFLPLTLIILFFLYGKDFFKIQRKYILYAVACFILVAAPIAWSTVFGGGAARFAYISVFTDPVTIPEVGFDRLTDAKARNNNVERVGLSPTLEERIIHNKFTWWKDAILRNYLQSFSTQFLFVNGDINLRHAPHLVGELYKIEAIFLILGLFYLFTKPYDKRIKLLIISLLLLAPIPSAITRDGGMHATRLFFLLPFLTILTSLGIYHLYNAISKKYKFIFLAILSIAYFCSIYLYQHNYWYHYPTYSQRWWHAGFEGAIKTAVAESPKYDKVIISMSDEPAFIFFLGWSQYPPNLVQGKLFKEKETIANFGEMSRLGKYYFGSPSIAGIYELGKQLPDNTLYVATAKEVNVNLIREPERTPKDLILVKAIAYPSGEPAFYLFTKASK